MSDSIIPGPLNSQTAELPPEGNRIIALILGGFIAAPFAAKLTGKLPRKTAFILLGLLVIIWSLKILSRLL